MGNVSTDIGFARGFDRYHDLFLDPAILSKRRKLDAAKEGLMHALHEGIALPRAEDINDYLFPWLEEQRDRKTFSFVWSIETHEPYIPHEDFRRFSRPSRTRTREGESEDIRSAGEADRQRLIDLYDDEIYYNDYCIGQMVSRLKTMGIYDDTFLIFLGDHGDGFYEHGFFAHGQAPFEELVHVPLIMKFPAERYAGRRVTDLVELIDIFPTVMAAAGLPSGTAGSTYLQGQNLLLGLEGEDAGGRECVFSETQSLQFHNLYRSVRSREWKYIERQHPRRDSRTVGSVLKYVIQRRMLVDILRYSRHFLRSYFRGSSEYLFDLRAEPREQTNLASEHPQLARYFGQLLIDWQLQNQALAEEVGSSPYTYEESEAMQRHLEELGYL